ncbi:2-oxoglutarate dehydrogenase E1 component [Roseateles depolymerans]|uniref:oxoglutarate dehydrogenase (succinyl-transferring) n=1 Tax=Roseateles depolymerans TaxID=76731 RepID=A0A0U3NBR7_9BURK|nr:2-oxoglutarate dehydrogenase E1 component [Roseateles depolymerans]ALV05952.1 2-oxoglutarate dehydrogenase E1 component [Roseateles depolymerans]REG09349.1 2-oxoglutarate dehydrogenase E1 component [Roseateles depolymerans]
MSVNRLSVGPVWAPARRCDRDADTGAGVAQAHAHAHAPQLRPGVAAFIETYRWHGHRFARLDPLAPQEAPDGDGSAWSVGSGDGPTLAQFGLSDDTALSEDQRPVLGATKAKDLHQRLRHWYCGTVALDVTAVRDEQRRAWLYQQFETEDATGAFADRVAADRRQTGPSAERAAAAESPKLEGDAHSSESAEPSLVAERAEHLLRRLAQVEGWERFLSRRYPHGKRFSLEGHEALIPLLEAVLARAASQGISRCVMGMPHRGRVNVLANLLGHPVDEIMDFFEPQPAHPERQKDLVYHLGGRYDVSTPHGAMAVTLASNPSHLQSVYPVVVGMARGSNLQHGAGRSLAAAQALSAGRLPAQRCLPVMMHGDAAFAGQGVVMETLALGLKTGYEVGGVIHIIINNQVGFTEPNRMDPEQSRFCTDVTRTVDAPVLRVSASDPEAVLRVAAMAVDYRARFGTDVVIDLVGFRRLGHSEHDEPMLTAPRLYAQMPEQPGVATRYAHRLVARGVLTDAAAHAALQALEVFDPAVLRAPGHPMPGAKASTAVQEAPQAQRARRGDEGMQTQGAPADIGSAPRSLAGIPWPASLPAPQAAAPVGTMPDADALRWVLANLADVPTAFEPHPLLARLAARWQRLAVGELTPQGRPEAIDWCTAESIAHALTLSAGVPLRISGLDVQRGTFMHRHAVWHNQSASGPAQWMPLSHFTAKASLEVHNSILSEEAVLGFEYGHSVAAPSAMTVWEAQFGDFVNGAQVFLDQYLSCGEEKWGSVSGLTVLLPHGYEGVGPEHSNAFLTRILLLCGADNLRVAMPSTAAQWALLLLQQALDPVKKPLVVMTPKAVLLGEPRSHTTLEALAGARFQPVIDDEAAVRAQVQRVLVCSGKVYYDLLSARASLPVSEAREVALVRVERLYPFPSDELADVLKGYPAATSLVWVQEETRNQGAWPVVRDELQALVSGSERLRLSEVSRPVTAAGATASAVVHGEQQRALVGRALGGICS